MAKARVFELSKSIPPVPEVPGQKREKWFFLDKPYHGCPFRFLAVLDGICNIYAERFFLAFWDF